MAERVNFLIGYGERLTTDMAAPIAGAPKRHPYTFAEARRRLAPKVKETVRELDELPEEVCPGDQTVTLMTLHPSYLAKSYYPGELLKAYQLETIGSRSREVSPDKWTKKKPPESAVTSELFVAGTRRNFRRFADNIDRFSETAQGADDLIKIEDIRVQAVGEKLKPLRSAEKEPLLEVVLHAQPIRDDAFILEGFEAYLESFGVTLDLDKRRFFAEGLCFLPLRIPREIAGAVAKYSFLRLAREMPRLRQFRPLVRASAGFTPFACELPGEDAIDRDIRVAVFDGGVKADGLLNAWVSRKKTKNIGAPVEEFLNHGTAVTSALLFGPLQDGVIADRPYAKVDHYRVLDEETLKDDQQELYTVLERIQDVLETRPKYDFVNLSLGPDLPIEGGTDRVIGNVLHPGRSVELPLLEKFAPAEEPARDVGQNRPQPKQEGDDRVQIELNLLPQVRPCWSAEEHQDHTVTLTPSVWRQSGCRSHFILRRGRVSWC